MSAEYILSQLDPAQREAVREISGPILIVAGAGSGKTRVLTYRVAYMLEKGIPASSILALTFTNKAANEMRSRIIDLVGPRSREVWMGTFHSMFARILRMEAEKIGYSRSFTIYDSEDSSHSVRSIMADLGISSQQFSPEAIRSRISGAKNQLVTPAAYAQVASDLFEEKTVAVYEEYEKRLRAQNAMDFDDLLIKPIELFQTNTRVLEKYQDRFKFILVDEYQDTNRAQFVLLNLLASKYRNLTVVGDDAQSIYAFRGADIRNILDFERTYPDCKIFRLEQNYRSTKRILSAASTMISKNRDQIPKTLWTANPEGDQITVLECDDEVDEGHQVAKEIENLLAHGRYTFRDCAVLYRTNAQSRSIEDALRRNGIPYTIIGGIEFYQRKEIKDVLAYLRIIVNPLDDESLLRIINTPPRGIGEATLGNLRRFAAEHQLSLFQALKQVAEGQFVKEIPSFAERSRKNLQSLAELLTKYTSFRDKMSASELARTLVDELGFLSTLKAEGTPEALSRWENIQELLSAISEFSSNNAEATLADFLEEVSLVSAIDRWEDDRSTVTLMTLHSAKGLEFPVVFIVGLEEGLLPLYTNSLDRFNLEEERRLCYVGMTRAKEKLYLTYTRMRYRFGDLNSSRRSRFIEEIDQNLLELRRPSLSGATASRFFPEKRSDPNSAKKTILQRVRGSTYLSRRDGHKAEHQENGTKAPQEINSLSTGMIVYHDSFGRGRIVDISGEGENARAVVNFDEVGRKLLLLKYAHLRKEEE